MIAIVSLITSTVLAVLTIVSFFLTRRKAAERQGKQQANIRNSIKEVRTEMETKFKEVQTEIDTRVKSVCEKHVSDTEKSDLQREYLSSQLHSHINENEKEHSELFHKMDVMVTDISEIKTGVAVLVAKANEKRE